ncbi:MAG: peptidylprolyl isomerase [Chloroflexota bacterium]
MANDPGKKPVVHTRKHIARLERERRQSRMILYAFIAIVVIVLGLLGYGYLDVNYLQARRPVAKVGEVKIISADFESRVRLQRQQYLVQYSQMQYYQAFGLDVSAQVQQIEAALNDSVSIGQSVLDAMIDEEIIRQEAAKRGITVSDEEIDEMIQQTFQYFPNGTPTPTITPTDVTMPTIPAEAFEIVTITPTPSETPALTETPGASVPTEGTDIASTGTPAPTNTSVPTATATATEGPTSTPEPTSTPYTLEGFQSEFQKTTDSLAKYDFTEEEYRALFEVQLLRNKLFEEVTKDVPRAEEQLWARHILVADEAAAQDVLARLNNGEDFAALAQELSQDTGSGANGGDLGWFGKGMMVAPFEEAAYALQPGEISDPVQSDFGFHIIQLIARQERPLAADAYNQVRETTFQDFLTTAREELGVETYDEFWMSRVPTEPNFITAATESANAANTAQAETAQAPEPTATP